MDKALKSLQQLSGNPTLPKGKRKMSSPTPDPADEVTISQSVIDGWANAIESAVAGLRAIIERGNIPQAEVAAMTQAITDLESVGTVVPDTPPVDPVPAPDDTPPANQ
jgi:hypothetical protein